MDDVRKYETAETAKTAEVALTALLGLKRRPVGIHFIPTEQEYENTEATEPSSGLPYCTAVGKACGGKSYKLDVRHNRCAASSTALGMLPVTEYRLSGQMHVDFKVYRDIEISRSVAEDMVYCKENNYGVLIKPLAEYKKKPDIVIVVLPAHSAMRLLQGYAYNYGQLKDIKMAGMCAICQECTSYPWVKNQPNVSMLCAGTRCVGRWKADELAVGIPGELLEGIIDGIWHTVDPMETETQKKEIIKRLSDAELEVPPIDMKHNYYSKAYGIPKKQI